MAAAPIDVWNTREWILVLSSRRRPSNLKSVPSPALCSFQLLASSSNLRGGRGGIVEGHKTGADRARPLSSICEQPFRQLHLTSWHQLSSILFYGHSQSFLVRAHRIECFRSFQSHVHSLASFFLTGTSLHYTSISPSCFPESSCFFCRMALYCF